ncbi:MAG: peptide MFS transporter [Acidobacteriota bacterium]|jgi:POT family proton-dependent oligopeptide transporter|nr:peptide MFS transporter [Acidobacteriota bacterium]MDQ3372480.1 peptide MFS transporter [Acidobacteriota bacterium]
MSANAGTIGNIGAAEYTGTVAGENKHPKGLYVLFGTEMWERFSFYSMLALFTLYLRDPVEGFGWTATQATSLYANYLMFVYASPLIGGFIADKITGYRKAVMIGGFFFMAGHGLLSIPALWAVYAALTCLVIGNGFFKPNVSTMVGNLYPEGSHLKDRAYNIFYMGINVGAMLAPIVMEVVKAYFGFHAAFAVAAFGMVISVAILWYFKNEVEGTEKNPLRSPDQAADTAATTVDAPPHGISDQDEGGHKAANAARQDRMNAVPDWKRVMALIVIFAIVIVFWMVFHQNGSTLTYWADDNTAWNVSGTISNSINPFWIIVLTFPLVAFWGWLDKRGMEPSTPTKMAIGMMLTGLSFFVLYGAAKIGENQPVTPQQYAAGSFRINERVAGNLKADGVPQDVLDKMLAAKDADGKNIINDVKFSAKDDETTKVNISGEQNYIDTINKVAPGAGTQYRDAFLQRSYLFQVSPFWLLLAYAIISLGELMLSPMGLSLVSKVAPIRMRGLLMGGWFVATAIGNKLTMIGIYWSIWYQSSFFIILGLMALIMSVVLFSLLKPLKRAMPGV